MYSTKIRDILSKKKKKKSRQFYNVYYKGLYDKVKKSTTFILDLKIQHNLLIIQHNNTNLTKVLFYNRNF